MIGLLIHTVIYLVDMLMGVIYPVYATLDLLSLRNRDRNRGRFKEFSQWATYWLVFAFLILFMRAIAFLPEFLFSFIYYLKVFFLILLAHPQFKGAALLYSELVEDPLRSSRIIRIWRKMKAKLRGKLMHHAQKEKRSISKVEEEKKQELKKEL